jgi:hypothetical protein
MKALLAAVVCFGLLIAWLGYRDLCTLGEANPVWQLTHCPMIYSSRLRMPAPAAPAAPAVPSYDTPGARRSEECRALRAVMEDRQRYGIGGAVDEAALRRCGVSQ